MECTLDGVRLDSVWLSAFINTSYLMHLICSITLIYNYTYHSRLDLELSFI